MPFHKEQPTIVQVFEASTGHMTKEDNKLLRLDDNGLCAYKYEYGDFIYTGVDDTNEDFKESMEGLRKIGYSEAFINLLTIARDHNCKFLQLDGEGTAYDDLPTYSWD